MCTNNSTENVRETKNSKQTSKSKQYTIKALFTQLTHRFELFLRTLSCTRFAATLATNLSVFRTSQLQEHVQIVPHYTYRHIAFQHHLDQEWAQINIADPMLLIHHYLQQSDDALKLVSSYHSRLLQKREQP